MTGAVTRANVRTGLFVLFCKTGSPIAWAGFDPTLWLKIDPLELHFVFWRTVQTTLLLGTMIKSRWEEMP